MTGRDELVRGLDQLGICLDGAQVEKLLAYAGMLARWNAVFNLTAVAEKDFISHHLLDSLSILPYVDEAQVVDVGSGGGLPGIPLAIALPACQVTLVDSNGKKSRFQEQARIELGLDNVSVEQGRVESLAGEWPLVTCRAFASLADISRMTAHLLAGNGRVLAMKSSLPVEENTVELAPLTIDAVIPLDVPGVSGERQLVVLRRLEMG